MAIRVRDATATANEAVILIRALTAQLAERACHAAPDVAKLATTLADSLGAVEGELYQVKNQSPKDKIAFPIKLNDRLTSLRSNLERSDAAPRESYQRVFRELSGSSTRCWAGCAYCASATSPH